MLGWIKVGTPRLGKLMTGGGYGPLMATLNCLTTAAQLVIGVGCSVLTLTLSTLLGDVCPLTAVITMNHYNDATMICHMMGT